jgi:DNA-binding NarL/FixJ family response regulator
VTTVEMGQVGNCYRCGAEFRRDDNSRVCPGCRRSQSGAKPMTKQLSFRERQVVNLVSQGKLNKEIAFELHLCEGTIKEYLNRIFRKTGATNRTELAVWALMREKLQGERVA